MKAPDVPEGPFLEDCEADDCTGKHLSMIVDDGLDAQPENGILVLDVTAHQAGGLLVAIFPQALEVPPWIAQLSRVEAFVLASALMEAVEIVDAAMGVE